MEKMSHDIAEHDARSEEKITKLTIIFDMELLSMRQVAYKPSNDDTYFVIVAQLSPAYFCCYCYYVMFSIVRIIAMDTAREMVHIFEANYPEILRRAFIINGIICLA